MKGEELIQNALECLIRATKRDKEMLQGKEYTWLKLEPPVPKKYYSEILKRYRNHFNHEYPISWFDDGIIQIRLNKVELINDEIELSISESVSSTDLVEDKEPVEDTESKDEFIQPKKGKVRKRKGKIIKMKK